MKKSRVRTPSNSTFNSALLDKDMNLSTNNSCTWEMMTRKNLFKIIQYMFTYMIRKTNISYFKLKNLKSIFSYLVQKYITFLHNMKYLFEAAR